MRILKQRQADEEAERIKQNIILQQQENKSKLEQARERNDPYKSKIPLGTEPAAGSRSKEAHDRRTNELKTRKTVVPVFREQVSENNDEDDNSDTIVMGKPRHSATMPTTNRLSPRRYSADDDRPITPMKTETYRHYSTPDTMGDQEIQDPSECAWSLRCEPDDDDEYQQVLTNFQQCLDDRTLTDQTLVSDDNEAGAYGPAAKDNKIKKLRAEGVTKLGQEKFDAIYKYLKKVQFDNWSPGKEIDVQAVRHDLRQICSNSDLINVVEQLLVLEMLS
jgi:hypothetical protein